MKRDSTLGRKADATCEWDPKHSTKIRFLTTRKTLGWIISTAWEAILETAHSLDWTRPKTRHARHEHSSTSTTVKLSLKPSGMWFPRERKPQDKNEEGEREGGSKRNKYRKEVEEELEEGMKTTLEGEHS